MPPVAVTGKGKKMKFTNKYNLPEAIYNAASAYSRKPDNDRFSCSELTTPPQMRTLRMKHWDVLEEDVSDRIWSLLGQCFHSVLERHASANAFTEEKMVYPIPELDGIILTGQPDLLDDKGILHDYKVTSAYSFLLGDKPEWSAQLNTYAFLYGQFGFDIKGLVIQAILRDWQRSKSLKDADYPVIPFQSVNIPMWSQAEQLSFIVEKINDHLQNPMRPCTADERWQTPDTYSVMKEGRKSSVRNLDTQEEAKKYMKDNNLEKGYYIEIRPGKSNRCEGYCNVSQYCDQYKKGVNHD